MTTASGLHGADLTLLRDPSGAIGRSYDVDSIPHLVIVGRDGRIAAIHLGYSKSEIPWLVGEINSLWNGAPQSAATTRRRGAPLRAAAARPGIKK